MSRQLKRQLGRADGGRGSKPSPAATKRPRTPEQRLNRMLMYGGALLALSAIVLALLSPSFGGRTLAINLGAIAIGLVMGKGIGRVMFRLPAAGTPGSNVSKRRS